MSTPGYMAIAELEVANSARTAAYLAAGLGSPQFEVTFGDVCPLLTELAWPLDTCPGLASSTDDQLYANPLPAYRVAGTGAAPSAAVAAWREAGWFGWAANAGSGPNGALVLPARTIVDQRVRVWLDVLTQTPGGQRTLQVAKMVGVGAGTVGWIGVGLSFNGGVWTLSASGRTPTAVNYGLLVSPGNGLVIPTLTIPQPTDLVLEVAWTAAGFTARLYGGDPDTGSPLIASLAYGFATFASGSWFTATGQTEAASFAAATEVGLASGNDFVFASTEMVVTEVAQLGPACVATGSSYPAAGAWPNDIMYPGSYGVFTNPGNDNAPWIDPDQPESYGFLGMVLTDLEGYDTTETRSLDAAASGRGGVLGPQQLQPRHLKAKGFLVAQNCAAMEYARRWLADALGGELCPGCDGTYLDLLPVCGDVSTTALRRFYDTGLEEFVADTSDAVSCCYVTPVAFTIAVANAEVYTAPEVVIASQALAPLAADTPAVPFETWLFGQPAEICVDLSDEGLGTDAAIITLYGGTSGISGGLVFRAQGSYPQSSQFPGDCVNPADGTPQWDMGLCPFVFDVSIGPGETFTVDSSRRRLEWTLPDGSVLTGAPRLSLAPGQVVQWIDTCDGADAQACVQAYANCTCDTSAAVTVATQHRER